MADRAPKTLGAAATGTGRLASVTFIVVDVDGVINVGISDRGAGALSCSTGNIAAAAAMKEEHRMQSQSAQLLLAVSKRQAEQETATYGELCKGSGQLADTYVRRLAEIIAAAKTQGKVICVLSSTWRTRNLAGVRTLQEGISKHLGEPWTFDTQTDSKECGTPSGRLENIGTFLSDWLATSVDTLDSIRVLVLEDFHITPLDGWKCKGKSMSSAQHVEAHLRECLPANMDVSTCLIHTFDSWTNEKGNGTVSVGCGLSLKHFHGAMDFLSCNVDAIEGLALKPSISSPAEDDASFLDEDGDFDRGISHCEGSGGHLFRT